MQDYSDIVGDLLTDEEKKKRPFPIEGVITSRPGDSRDGGTRKHAGTDIAAKRGTPVPWDWDDEGEVTHAGPKGGYGNLVEVRAPGRKKKYRYAHLDGFDVRVGDRVKPGQQLGRVGNTGKVIRSPGGDGSHLHYEELDDDTPDTGPDYSSIVGDLVNDSPAVAAPEPVAAKPSRAATAPVRGQIEPGNVDLTKRPKVKNPDGTTSTVRSISIEEDGQEVLIPTVSDDGRVMSDDEAVEQYRRTQKHLGKFASAEEATSYAEQLHADQAATVDEPATEAPDADYSSVVSDLVEPAPKGKTAARRRRKAVQRATKQITNDFGFGRRGAVGIDPATGKPVKDYGFARGARVLVPPRRRAGAMASAHGSDAFASRTNSAGQMLARAPRNDDWARERDNSALDTGASSIGGAPRQKTFREMEADHVASADLQRRYEAGEEIPFSARTDRETVERQRRRPVGGLDDYLQRPEVVERLYSSENDHIRERLATGDFKALDEFYMRNRDIAPPEFFEGPQAEYAKELHNLELGENLQQNAADLREQVVDAFAKNPLGNKLKGFIFGSSNQHNDDPSLNPLVNFYRRYLPDGMDPMNPTKDPKVMIDQHLDLLRTGLMDLINPLGILGRGLLAGGDTAEASRRELERHGITADEALGAVGLVGDEGAGAAIKWLAKSPLDAINAAGSELTFRRERPAQIYTPHGIAGQVGSAAAQTPYVVAMTAMGIPPTVTLGALETVSGAPLGFENETEQERGARIAGAVLMAGLMKPIGAAIPGRPFATFGDAIERRLPWIAPLKLAERAHGALSMGIAGYPTALALGQEMPTWQESVRNAAVAGGIGPAGGKVDNMQKAMRAGRTAENRQAEHARVMSEYRSLITDPVAFKGGLEAQARAAEALRQVAAGEHSNADPETAQRMVEEAERAATEYPELAELDAPALGLRAKDLRTRVSKVDETMLHPTVAAQHREVAETRAVELERTRDTARESADRAKNTAAEAESAVLQADLALADATARREAVEARFTAVREAVAAKTARGETVAPEEMAAIEVVVNELGAVRAQEQVVAQHIAEVKAGAERARAVAAEAEPIAAEAEKAAAEAPKLRAAADQIVEASRQAVEARFAEEQESVTNPEQRAAIEQRVAARLEMFRPDVDEGERGAMAKAVVDAAHRLGQLDGVNRELTLDQRIAAVENALDVGGGLGRGSDARTVLHDIVDTVGREGLLESVDRVAIRDWMRQFPEEQRGYELLRALGDIIVDGRLGDGPHPIEGALKRFADIAREIYRPMFESGAIDPAELRPSVRALFEDLVGPDVVARAERGVDDVEVDNDADNPAAKTDGKPAEPVVAADNTPDKNADKQENDDDILLDLAGERGPDRPTDEEWDSWSPEQQKAHVKAVHDAEERQAGLAQTDALTGVGSRHARDAEYRRIWKATGRKPLVAALDANGLGATNDNFGGHPAGDTFLKKIAEILMSKSPLLQKIYRGEGGDEFYVILDPDTDPEVVRQAIVEAEAELRQFEFLFEDKDGNEIIVSNNSISHGIGIGIKGPEGADARLYEDKDRRVGTDRPAADAPKGTVAPDVSVRVRTGAEEQRGEPRRADAGTAPRAARETVRGEVPRPTAAGRSAQVGRDTRIIFPGSSEELPAVYAVRELADVIPSHDAETGNPDPRYPWTNDRDYSNKQNLARVQSQAQRFKPDLVLTDNPTAETGPPIVSGDGHVYGGNSRAMTIALVYRNGAEAARAYREGLIARAKAFGLDPAAIEAMKEPVLVREVTGDVKDAQGTITDLNAVGTAKLARSERTIAESRRVSPKTLQFFADGIESLGDEATVARLLADDGVNVVNRLIADGVFTEQERPGLMDEDGRLSDEAKSRIRDVFIGRLFRNREQFENTPPAMRLKMERVVGPVSRTASRRGADLTADLQGALDLIEEAKATKNANVRDVGMQSSMQRADTYSENVIAIAETLQLTPLKVAGAFKRYVNNLDAGLFGELTPQEAFDDAFRPDLPARGPGEIADNGPVDSTNPTRLYQGPEGNNRSPYVGARPAGFVRPDAPRYTREKMRSDWIENFGLSEEKADAVIALTDARAKVWASQNNSTPDEYYARRFAGVVRGGEPGVNALGQDPNAEPRLMALHNTTADQLLFGDRVGGFPAPSLAVLPRGTDFSRFGDITLVGDRGLVDPQGDPTNLLHNADIYSPRQPHEQHDYVKKGKLAFETDEELRRAWSDYYGRRPGPDLDAYGYNADKPGTIYKLSREGGMKLAFIRSKGQDVPMAERPQRTTLRFQPEAFDVVAGERFPRKYQEIDAAEYARVDRAFKKVLRATHKIEGRTSTYAEALKRYTYEDDQVVAAYIDRFLEDVETIRSGKKEVDTEANDAALDAKIEQLGGEDAFKAWVADRVKPVFTEGYLLSGKKKVPYTAEAALDDMTRRKQVGSEKTMVKGLGAAKATASKKLTSIEQARELAAAGIKSKADAETVYEQHRAELGEIATLLAKDSEFGSMWEAMDGVGGAVKRYLAGRPRTTEAMRQAFAKEGFRNPSAEVLTRAMELGRAVHEAPVEYFESKPQRVVGLGDFKGAVIPDDTPPAARKALETAGVRIETYPAGDQAARQQAVDKFNDVFFQPAWHGSPHTFSEFGLHAIGRGQGAQTFGWGLYLAGHKAVAEFYRDTVKGRGFASHALVDGQRFDLNSQEAKDISASVSHENRWIVDGYILPDLLKAKTTADIDAAFARLEGNREYGSQAFSKSAEGQKLLADLKARVTFKEPDPSRLYKVDIPEDHLFLDYDKPLSEQSPEVLAALKKIPEEVWEDIGDQLEDYGMNRIEGPDDPDYKGGELYKALQRHEGSLPFDDAASGDTRETISRYLGSLGIAGIRYADKFSRGKGEPEQTHNYVVFDDKLVKILEMEHRPDEGRGAKASVEFLEGNQALIRALESPDVSSGVHELGHVFLEDLRMQGGEDLRIAAEWAGVEGDNWQREHHEKFARGFERYLAEGKAPTPELKGVFENFKQWIVDIYKSITGSQIDVKLSPEIRGVMDRLLAEVPRVDETAKPGQEAPDVSTKPQKPDAPEPPTAKPRSTVPPKPRPWKAGTNEGAVQFASNTHRDLFDIGTELKRAEAVSRTGGARPPKDMTSIIDRVATELRVSPEKVRLLALGVRADVTAQMRGLKAGETRAVKDSFTVDIEETLRKRVEDAVGVADLPIPGSGVRVDVGGGKPSQPATGKVQEDVQFAPAQEAQYQSSKDLAPKQSTMERVKEIAVSAWHKATRPYEHLARGARHAEFFEDLKELEVRRGVASDKAITQMKGLLAGFSRAQYDVFNRKVVLDDLYEELRRREARNKAMAPEPQAELEAEIKRLRTRVEGIQKTLEAARATRDTRESVDNARAVQLAKRSLDKVRAERDSIAADLTAKHVAEVRAKKAALDALRQEQSESIESSSDLSDAIAAARSDYERARAKKITSPELEHAKAAVAKIAENLNRMRGEAKTGNKSKVNEAREALGNAKRELRRAEEKAANVQKVRASTDLAFGFDPKTLHEARQRVDAAVASDSAIAESIALRQTLWRKVTDDYLAAAKEAVGFEPPMNRQNYFRNIIVENLDAKRTERVFKEAVEGFHATTNDPFTKRREATNKNFLSDYVRAEHDALSMMLQRTREFQILRDISHRYNVGDELRHDHGRSWQDNIPDGHVVWQPKPGRQFFEVMSVGEAYMTELLRKGVDANTVIPVDKLQEMLAAGSKNKEWVIPEEVAATLDAIEAEPPVSAIRKTVRLWKKLMLQGPHRFIKYNIRNVTGDADGLLAANPKAAKEVPAAARDLYNFLYRQGAASPDLKTWIELGGMQDLFRGAELGADVGGLKQFKQFYDKRTLKEYMDPRTWMRAYNDAVGGASDAREALLRYALFRQYKREMARNPEGKPDSFGASIPSEVMAIANLDRRAHRMSNDALGAYNELTVMGRYLRDTLWPFWSWNEVNVKRYKRVITNAFRDKTVTEGFGQAVLKGAGILAVRSPAIAFKVGKTAAAMSVLSAGLAGYNLAFFPDEEADLPEDVRKRPHMIFGRDSEGNVLYFDRMGAVGDALEWFGKYDDQKQVIADYLDGKLSWNQAIGAAATNAGWTAIDKIAQGMGPAKTVGELGFGVQLYPSIYKPRPIRDRRGFIIEGLGFGTEYGLALGRPNRGLGRMVQDQFLYQIDPDEAAFNDIRSLANKFDEKLNGPKQKVSREPTDKSNALYYYKVALKYGDKDAAEQYFNEFASLTVGRSIGHRRELTGAEIGQINENLAAAIEAADPLYGLAPEERAEFISTLKPRDRTQLDKATKFWRETLLAEDTGLEQLAPRDFELDPYGLMPKRKGRDGKPPLGEGAKTVYKTADPIIRAAVDYDLSPPVSRQRKGETGTTYSSRVVRTKEVWREAVKSLSPPYLDLELDDAARKVKRKELVDKVNAFVESKINAEFPSTRP